MNDQYPTTGEAMSREAMTRKDKERADEIANTCVMEFQRRASSRGNFESQWTEIAQRCVPLHNRNFNTFNQFTTKGEKRTEFIFDSTAAIALERFGAILDSLLTPRNQIWHGLLSDNSKVMKVRSVRLYFEEVTRLLFKYRYAPKANFTSQNQQNYLSLGAYGTGSLFIDELQGEPGVRYKNVHLSQCFFAENHQGIVDECDRHFPLTARQCFQKWGDSTPDLIKSALKNNPDQEFWFLHVAKPRQDPDIERLDYKGMPWASFYISMTDRKLLSEGGFNTFPYAISRYKLAENEIYGRSPAMEVLPAMKTLNEQKKTLLKQGHRAVDPVLLLHDDGILSSFSLRPGAKNTGAVSADGRPLVHALPVGNVQAGKELMDDERKVINDAFLINIFQILVETPEMTATEVLERAREKGILLAPTVGRQQSEYLGPMIDREIDVLARQGLLPPMPDELKAMRGEYQVQYNSPLSRAQRADEAAGTSRTIEQAINVATTAQKPEVLDYFNWDVIIPEMADINGVPVSWLNSPEAIANIRKGRSDQAQNQQMTQALPGTAAMVKSLAVAKQAGGGGGNPNGGG